MTTNIRAAHAVAILVPDRTEARHFLEMLGLVDDDNRITPDDTRAGSNQGTGHRPVIRETLHTNDKPKYSTAPEALRVLAPAVPRVVVPGKKKQRAPRPPTERTLIEGVCGTLAGHATHIRRGVKPCDPCREARNAVQRAYWQKTKGKGKDPRRPPCGTPGGYDAHLRRKEEACDPCKAASALRQREKYQRALAKTQRVVKPKKTAECGTYSGYTRHRRRKEERCAPCREAARLYYQEYDQRRKKAA